MKTKKLITTTAIFIIIMAIWLLQLYFPPKCLPEYPKFFTFMTGFSLLLSTFGLIGNILLATFFDRLKAYKTNAFRTAELEINFRRFSLEQQMADAEKRRQHDLLLYHNKAVIDLIDVTKTKEERTKDPVLKEEKNGSKEQPAFYKETHTESKVNIEAFVTAFEEYKKLNSIQ